MKNEPCRAKLSSSLRLPVVALYPQARGLISSLQLFSWLWHHSYSPPSSSMEMPLKTRSRSGGDSGLEGVELCTLMLNTQIQLLLPLHRSVTTVLPKQHLAGNLQENLCLSPLPPEQRAGESDGDWCSTMPAGTRCTKLPVPGKQVLAQSSSGPIPATGASLSTPSAAPLTATLCPHTTSIHQKCCTSCHTDIR